MSKANYTSKEEKYILRHYKTIASRAISETLGRHRSAVTDYLRARGLEIPHKLNREYQKYLMSTHHTGTKETDRYIRKHYLTHTPQKIANHFGRSERFVDVAMKRLGLVIPDDIKQQRIQAGRFKKGMVSHNKGKPMPAAVYKKAKATMFKKGNLPPNTKPEGEDISLRRDTKTGRYYVYYRKKLGEWVLYHRYIWEQANGPIPPDMVVSFVDGDTANLQSSNLQLITHAELARRNRKHYPEDTRRMIKLVKKLKHLVNVNTKR